MSDVTSMERGNDEDSPSGPDHGGGTADSPESGHGGGQNQPGGQPRPGGGNQSGGHRQQQPRSDGASPEQARQQGRTGAEHAGGDDSGTAGSRLSGLPVTSLLVIALVVLAGVGAAQILLLGGGDGTASGADASDAVGQVPAGVDSITRVDAGVLEDESIAELYAKVYNTTVGEGTAEGGFGPGDDEGGSTDESGGFGPDGPLGPGAGMPTAGLTAVPETLTEFREAVENETGVDPTAVEEVVTFQKQPAVQGQSSLERGSADAFAAPYVGTIVHAEWSPTEMVRVVENNTMQDLERTTVSGTTVYRPTGTDETGEEVPMDPVTTGWLAVLGDGEYVVGTPEVVNDTIAVANGEADPVGGDLLAAYERTPDGFVRSVQRSRNVNVTRLQQFDAETGANLTAYAEAYNDLHVTASSTYTTDDGLGSETVILTNSTDTARDVESLVDGFRSIQAGAIQNETVEGALRSMEISRDGTTVRLSRETSVETAVEIIEWYLDLLGTGATTNPPAPNPVA